MLLINIPYYISNIVLRNYCLQRELTKIALNLKCSFKYHIK